MEDQLKNINSLLIRNEYKVRIYTEYFLGSYRFLFSVHDLGKGQIKELNDLTHSYLKDWLGLPQGASWALVHDYHGLNVKSIYHLYTESRALSLSNMRFFGDQRVRHALDSKEEREGGWSRKFSPATHVKGLIAEVVPPLPIETISTEDQDPDVSLGSDVDEIPASPPVVPPGTLSRKLLKGKIQSGVQGRVNDFWREKVGNYIMQGDYLALIMEEGNCVTWRSFIWDIPQGVLKFAINAGINTLPTLDNLRRWGKRTNDRCPFCGNIQTLLHVLSNCNVALEQGRYTWRHNSVLSSIIASIVGDLNDGFSLFSDLEGFHAPHGGVIPPDVLVTNLKPDLFLVNESDRVVVLLELTCPFDTNIERSHNYKQEKYAPLVADLSRDFKVFQFSIEVSVRGQITKGNRARIKSFAYRCCRHPKNVTGILLKSCSKLSLLCSYSIFSARKEPSWSSPRLLAVR